MNNYTISKELLIEIINKLDSIKIHADIHVNIDDDINRLIDITKEYNYIPPKDTIMDNLKIKGLSNLVNFSQMTLEEEKKAFEELKNAQTIKNAYHPISEKVSPSLTEFLYEALNYSDDDRLVNHHNKLKASEASKLLNVTPAAVAYWRKIPDHELKYDVEISTKGKTTYLYDKATVMEFAKKYKRYWHKNKKIIK